MTSLSRYETPQIRLTDMADVLIVALIEIWREQNLQLQGGAIVLHHSWIVLPFQTRLQRSLMTHPIGPNLGGRGFNHGVLLSLSA